MSISDAKWATSGIRVSFFSSFVSITKKLFKNPSIDFLTIHGRKNIFKGGAITWVDDNVEGIPDEESKPELRTWPAAKTHCSLDFLIWRKKYTITIKLILLKTLRATVPWKVSSMKLSFPILYSVLTFLQLL